MSLVNIRKKSLTIETIYHEMGPAPAVPLRMAAACAVWHEAGGWAMREVLGQPKAIVPANKAVAQAGYRIMVPVHYIHACYVRSHFNSMEIGIQDAPRPNEILFALVMGTGWRLNPRLGGLALEGVKGDDGQR